MLSTIPSAWDKIHPTESFPVHCSSMPARPRPLPGASLPTLVISISPSTQAQGVPTGYFHYHSNPSSINGSFSQPLRLDITAPSSHAGPLGLDVSFGSLPWMQSRNAQGAFPAHVLFNPMHHQAGQEALNLQSSQSNLRAAQSAALHQPLALPCPGRRVQNKNTESRLCIIHTAFSNVTTHPVTSCRAVGQLLNSFAPPFTYQ